MAASKARPKAEVLRDIEDLGLGSLEEVFNVLREAALGLTVLVGVDDPPPKRSKLRAPVAVVDVEKGQCPRCGHWPFSRPKEVFHAYTLPPDTGIARYLHEHLAGKAKVREEKQVDPSITVIFAADLTAKPDLDEIEEEAAREGVAPIDWGKE